MEKKTIIFALFILFAFSKCTPFKIAVSEGLTAAPELPVKGRQGLLINQKLSFGEFSTDKVRRSWTKGHDVPLGDMETVWVKYADRKQTFRFNLADASGNSAETFCIAKTDVEDWTIGNNPNSIANIMIEVLGFDGPGSNTMAADIFMKEEKKPWQLRLDIQEAQRKSKKYIGYLAQSKDSYYTLHPITTVNHNGKVGSIPFGSTGFQIKNKAGLGVAAVSLIDKGAVYISATDPKERLLLANATAAILLHQVID